VFNLYSLVGQILLHIVRHLLLHITPPKHLFQVLYNLFPLGCIEYEVLWPSSNIFFLCSSTTETHTRLWNLMVLSSWITNPNGFPTSISSLICSSCGSVACATRISSIRVSYTFMACNIDFDLGVTTLSSNFENSLQRSTGNFIRQFSTGYGRRLNASATAFSFSWWY